MVRNSLTQKCILIPGNRKDTPDTNDADSKNKTYSSGDSHVVTHRTTNPPVRSLSTPERTGWSVLCDLRPYV